MNRTKFLYLSSFVAFIFASTLLGSHIVKNAEANTPINIEKIGKTKSATIYRFETAQGRCYVADAAFGAVKSVAISCIK